MHHSHRILPILILSLLLTACAGCAASANVQPEAVKAAEETSTELLPEPTPVGTATLEVFPQDPPESCLITKAPDVPFVPPEPYPARPPERYASQFWYGTPGLWTMLGTDGTWGNLPHNKDGYSQKVFWWSQDFHVNTDPYPAFTLIIEQLDASMPASPVVVSEKATNASADFGTAMLTGVAVPEPGCWKITGRYKQAELSFVVRVTP